jgi:aspartyl-tRNA(Asn)/glutamyl-tRNA(Gln) amidotransferase subunit B
VRLVRAHLEEDAGKSLHEDFTASGIDLNRAGTPLLEIVTEPDMRSARKPWPTPSCTRSSPGSASATATCRKAFRCDANVSCASPAPLGTRREIKNLNSFKFMQQAIDYEIRWQIEQIEDGHAIQQATVLFNPDTGETRAMRTKEDAADYRYFPDPDLPPLASPQWIERTPADARAAPRHGRALRAALRPARVRRHHADAEQAMAAYFEAAAGLRPAQAGQQLGDGRGVRA